MKALIRLFLILITIAVFLWNYQIFSFGYGFVKIEQSEEVDILKEVSFYANVDEISYYQPIATPFETIIVFKSKSEGSRIYKITDKDLKAITTVVSIVNILGNVEMKEVTTIPWFVYLGVIVLFLFIPLGPKKRKRK